MSETKPSYTSRRFHDPLDDLLDRPIAFNPAFKKITGSTVAALMLSQAWYWSKRTSDEDGWFYKVQAEWEEETGLTRTEQETARRILEERGIMEERLSGVPARLYYRIFKERIYQLMNVQFAETLQTGLQEPCKQECGIPANINESEITSETTTLEEKKFLENAEPGWLIAAGVSSEENARINQKIQAEKEVTDSWERAMSYNPLPWGSEKGLRELKKFLLTKTPGEVAQFAAWARREFSPLSPAKARQNPTLVIELWPLAFPHREELPRHNDADEILNDDESKYVPPPEDMK